jgi:hypothetical protein
MRKKSKVHRSLTQICVVCNKELTDREQVVLWQMSNDIEISAAHQSCWDNMPDATKQNIRNRSVLFDINLFQ